MLANSASNQPAPAAGPALSPGEPPVPLSRRFPGRQARDREIITGFRGGCLYVLRGGRAHAIELWPRLRSWVWHRDGRWRIDLMGRIARRCLPHLPWEAHLQHEIARGPGGLWLDEDGQLLIRAAFRTQCREWWHGEHTRRLLAAVPPELVVPNDGMAQFPLLRFAQSGPHPASLCRTNPALALMLAWPEMFQPALTPGDAARMADWPQRRILAAFGFPPTERMRKRLAALGQSGLNSELLLELRSICKRPELEELLRLVARPNFATLMWLRTTVRHGISTPSLVADFARQTESGDFAGTTDFPDEASLLCQAAQFGLWQPRPLHSLHQLHKVAVKLSRHLQRTAKALPAPPTEGDLGLVPLRTADELADEAREARNCLGRTTFLVAALAGHTCYFRVLSPKRGTLELRMRAPGKWRLGQFQWVGNTEPDDNERHEVAERLHRLLGDSFVHAHAGGQAAFTHERETVDEIAA
jgi:hypothetical protein